MLSVIYKKKSGKVWNRSHFFLERSWKRVCKKLRNFILAAFTNQLIFIDNFDGFLWLKFNRLDYAL